MHIVSNSFARRKYFKMPSPSLFQQHNGSSTGGSSVRGSGLMLRKRRPNWIDAPDDSFFLVSRETRKARRLLSRSQLRRACRQPCEQISLRRVPQGPAQVPVLAPPHPSLRMRGPIVIHDWPSPALFPQPLLSLSHLLPNSAQNRPQATKTLLVPL